MINSASFHSAFAYILCVMPSSALFSFDDLNELNINTSAKFCVKWFFPLKPCNCYSSVDVKSEVQKSRIRKWYKTKWEHRTSNSSCELGVVVLVCNPSTEDRPMRRSFGWEQPIAEVFKCLVCNRTYRDCT